MFLCVRNIDQGCISPAPYPYPPDPSLGIAAPCHSAGYPATVDISPPAAYGVQSPYGSLLDQGYPPPGGRFAHPGGVFAPAGGAQRRADCVYGGGDSSYRGACREVGIPDVTSVREMGAAAGAPLGSSACSPPGPGSASSSPADKPPDTSPGVAGAGGGDLSALTAAWLRRVPAARRPRPDYDDEDGDAYRPKRFITDDTRLNDAPSSEQSPEQTVPSGDGANRHVGQTDADSAYSMYRKKHAYCDKPDDEPTPPLYEIDPSTVMTSQQYYHHATGGDSTNCVPFAPFAHAH